MVNVGISKKANYSSSFFKMSFGNLWIISIVSDIRGKWDLFFFNSMFR